MKENMRINEYVVASQYHRGYLVHSECLVGIKAHCLGTGTTQMNQTRFFLSRNLQSSWKVSHDYNSITMMQES